MFLTVFFCCCNNRYLCLLFRQTTGTTINHYLTTIRMEKAKELLMDLSNKLYDVSYAVGYMNPSYFSRQFKKYTGLLPSEYREKNHGGEGTLIGTSAPIP